MLRSWSLCLSAMLLVTAGSARAAERGTGAAPAAGKPAAADPKPAASEPRSRKAKDAAKLTAVARAKQEFVLRMDACIPEEQCNRELQGFIEAAEPRFMEACLACATEERCEAERKLIRAGKAKRSVNPCQK